MSEIASPSPRKSKSRRLPVITAPAAGQAEDVAWENELIIMLSGLETPRARLADSTAAGALAPPAEAMVAMAQHVKAFADRRLSPHTHGEALLRVRTRAGEFLDDAAQLLKQVLPSVLRTVGRLFGR